MSQISTLSDSATVDFGYPAAVKIEKGRRVRLKVELTAGSEVIEKSVVEFVHGAGTMLAGLEALLVGLEPGAKREGTLPAKDAFGDPAMHPVKKMKRTEFPADAKLELGTKFLAKGADQGIDVVLQIEKVDGDTVETRLVHPLADKDLAYKLEVVQVTDPRPPPMPAAALKLEESDES
jgi:FKBP-type peptidyl-prolyl cis-trans isomerase 2